METYNNKNKQKMKKELVKGILKKVAMAILIMVSVAGILLAASYYKEWKVERDYEIFKKSTAYIDGMTKDLASYKMEYVNAESEVEKKAIYGYVVEKFANFDENNIENDNLVEFLNQCREGEKIKNEE